MILIRLFLSCKKINNIQLYVYKHYHIKLFIMQKAKIQLKYPLMIFKDYFLHNKYLSIVQILGAILIIYSIKKSSSD